MTGTEDLFTPVHKGLRSMMYDLSNRLQTHDFADLAATQALMADLETDFATARSAGCVLCSFAFHAEGEDTVVFPPTARVANKLVTELLEEHHEFTRRELEIGKLGHETLAIPSAEARIASGIRLNQLANELFAAYIAHMNREETELVPVLRDHFSDAEQAKMRGTIISKFPPDRFFALLGWMLPALNVTELSELLNSVKGTIPPPVLKAVTDLCAARVEPKRWAAVKVRTGL